MENNQLITEAIELIKQTQEKLSEIDSTILPYGVFGNVEDAKDYLLSAKTYLAVAKSNNE